MNEAIGGQEPPAPLIGTTFGRYRLERLLGEGGMGVVYAARHEDLDKLAAIKLLNEHYAASEQDRARFLREGRTASRIGHPNIVDVYDVGSDAGRVFLVMELLQGETLRHLLTREGVLSPERTADLLVPVVSALAAAHDRGVVHRDLKPDNVFLAVHRNGVTPKVLDFGISKVLDDNLLASITSTGAFLGTPFYMAPEQTQAADRVDARSDQYSLGVIMYECVTGRRPIEDRAVFALIHRIVNGDFAPPRQLCPELSSAFEALILKAMARDPAERFADMRALGAAMLVFAGDRVRANYREELEQGTPQPTPAARAEQSRSLELLTTVSEAPASPPSPHRSRRRSLIWAAFGLMLVMLVSFALARRSAPPAQSEAERQPVPALSVGEHSTAPRLASDAERTGVAVHSRPKRLVSEPAGADVWHAGSRLGATPLSIDVPPGEELQVELRLEGYAPLPRAIAASDPELIVVALRPAVEPARREPRGARSRARPELAPR